MNNLLQVRTNILYQKNKKETPESPDEYTKIHELVFLVSKPKYTLSANLEDVVKDVELEEIRFCVHDENYDNLLAVLENFKNVEEENLNYE